MSKGDHRRPTDKRKFDKNFDRIFRQKSGINRANDQSRDTVQERKSRRPGPSARDAK